MTRAAYYRRLAQIFLAYKRRRTVLPYLPLRLWVEPTSLCNLKCVMCPNKDLPREEKGSMDFGLFTKVIDEAARFVAEANFTHRGESLLHPDFFQIVRYAHDAGIVTKFHTNGTLLDEEKARRLLVCGLDQFTFSVDGYDKATYESIRVNGVFEKTMGNIRRFLELKREAGAKKPTTILELIDFPDVYRRVDPATKKAFLGQFKGLPLDHIRVKELHNWAGEVEGAKKGNAYSPCTFLWASLVIFWDGRVCPCTQDFHGVLDAGRAGEKSLAEIWNGPFMVNLRERAVRGDIKGLEPCGACDRPWRARFLGVPREYVWRLLLRRMP